MSRKRLSRRLPAMMPAVAGGTLTGPVAAGSMARDSPGGASQNGRVDELLRSATTSSGAPIHISEGPLELMVSKHVIAPRAALPAHKHLFPRYGYVLPAISW